eukprot:14877601-Alexandrium_andersonii.AAC.1
MSNAPAGSTPTRGCLTAAAVARGGEYTSRTDARTSPGVAPAANKARARSTASRRSWSESKRAAHDAVKEDHIFGHDRTVLGLNPDPDTNMPSSSWPTPASTDPAGEICTPSDSVARSRGQAATDPLVGAGP